MGNAMGNSRGERTGTPDSRSLLSRVLEPGRQLVPHLPLHSRRQNLLFFLKKGFVPLFDGRTRVSHRILEKLRNDERYRDLMFDTAQG